VKKLVSGGRHVGTGIGVRHLYWCGRNIFVRRYDTLVLNREQILAIAARYGARNVRVFGSVVRGEDTPESDVDLLVEFEPGRGLLNHAALIEELQNLLGCKVDVASHNGLKPRIRQRVIEEAVVL
jgi:hypothetical protein